MWESSKCEQKKTGFFSKSNYGKQHIFRLLFDLYKKNYEESDMCQFQNKGILFDQTHMIEIRISGITKFNGQLNDSVQKKTRLNDMV